MGDFDKLVNPRGFWRHWAGPTCAGTHELPNIGAGTALTVAQARQRVYDDLEQIRKLRNRIARHEPIITRNLQNDFQRIDELVTFRCHDTAGWMRNNQQAVTLIAARP